jgi:Fur family transcriptional regulator, ferric uptake regulator
LSVPHLTPAVEAPTAAAAARTLRRRGLRLSAARRLVLEALFAAGRPMSAEEIASGADGLAPSDLASVYRNLETLEAVGLVRHMHLGHGPGRYGLASRQDELATCERCGACAVLPAETAEAVRAAVRAAVGFEPHFHHFPLAGLCPACAAARPDTEESRHVGIG